jgi:hypothetical protein
LGKKAGHIRVSTDLGSGVASTGGLGKKAGHIRVFTDSDSGVAAAEEMVRFLCIVHLFAVM